MTEPVPQPQVLEGRLIRLEAMTPEHIDRLMAISRRWPQEYELTSTPVDERQAEAYFGTAFAEQEAGRAYPFTIFHRETGEPIGSTRFADIRWRHRNAELGYTWFRPDMQRTGANVESKLLMLELAFERLEWVRVQIHTDTRNLRSQRAIEALGAVFEGVLRRHMIVKDGFVRDTRVYSIVDLEWQQVRERLLARLRERGIYPFE